MAMPPDRLRQYGPDRLNRLYGRERLSRYGDLPSYEEMRNLGRLKRQREEEEKRRKEEEEKRKKEAEEKAVRDLIEEMDRMNQRKENRSSTTSSSSRRNEDEDDEGFFDTLLGMGKSVGTMAGRGIRDAFQLINPFDDVGMDEIRERSKRERAELEEDKGYRDARNLAHSITGGATFGGLQNPEYTEEGAINTIGQLIGSLYPGGRIVQGLQGTRAAARLAPGMSHMQRAGQRAKEGMTAGGVYSVLDAGAAEMRDPNERDLGDHLRNIALETAFGGVVDPAIGRLLDALPTGSASRVSREIDPTAPREPVQPQQPSPSARNVLREQPALPELPNARSSIGRSPRLETRLGVEDSLSRRIEANPDLRNNMQRQLEIESELPNITDPDQRQARDITLMGLEEEFADLNPNRIRRSEPDPTPIRQAETQRAELENEYEQMRQAFIEKGIDPYTNDKQMSDAMAQWDSVKKLREDYNNVRKTVSKFRIPDLYKEEYSDLVPRNFISNKSNIDIFDAAAEAGFPPGHEGATEFAQFLRNGVNANKTRMKDLVPDRQVSRQELDEVRRIYEQTFPETEDAIGMRKVIDAYDEEIERLRTSLVGDYEGGINITSQADVQPNPLNLLDDLPRADGTPPPRTRVEGEEPNFARVYDGGNRSRRQASTIQNAKDRAIRRVSDDLHPVKKIENIVGDEELNLYRDMRLVRGAGGATENYAKQNIPPIIERFEQSGNDLREGMDYVLDLHLKDVADKNPGYQLPGGRNYEAITQNIRDKQGNPAFQELADGFRKIQNDMLDMMEDNGLISADTRRELMEKYPNYFPLFRQKDLEGAESFYTRVQQMKAGNVNKFLHELESGSEELLKDPIDNITRYISNTHSAAFNNRAMQNIERLNNVKIDGKLIARKVTDKNRHQFNKGNIVSFFKNGEKVEYYVNDDINQALNNLKGIVHGNDAFRFVESIAKFQRQSITANPFFSMRQVIRDIPQAWTVGNFSMVRDLPVAMMEVMSNGKFTGELLDNFMKHGGGMSNMVSMDRNAFHALQRASNQLVDNPNIKDVAKDKVGGFVNRWLDRLRGFNEALENAPKLAQYRATLRRTGDHSQAALEARDIMDFARSGETVRHVNRVAAFINANIQGKSKQLRAFQERPISTATKTFIAGAIPSIAAYQTYQFLASEEQKAIINESPEWQRQTYWLVPAFWNDTDVLRIPKPYEVAMLSSTPIEFLLYEQDKVGTDGADFLNEWLKQALVVDPSLNPATPLYEVMMNQDSFTGREIVPADEQDLPASEQGDVYTSSLARAGSTFTGGLVSPRIIQHLMEGFSPVTGETVNDLVDAGLEATGVRENQKPAGSVDIPLVDDLLIRGEGYLANELVGEAHETQQTVQRQKSRMQDEGQLFPYSNAYQAIREISTTDSELAGQIRSIDNDPNLSAEEKRDRRNALLEERNRNVRSANRVGLFDTEEENLSRLESSFSELGAGPNRDDILTTIKGQLVNSGIPEVDAQALVDRAREAEMSNLEIAQLVYDFLRRRQ